MASLCCSGWPDMAGHMEMKPQSPRGPNWWVLVVGWALLPFLNGFLRRHHAGSLAGPLLVGAAAAAIGAIAFIPALRMRAPRRTALYVVLMVALAACGGVVDLLIGQ